MSEDTSEPPQKIYGLDGRFPIEVAKYIADYILSDIFEDLNFSSEHITDYVQMATQAISSELREHISDKFDYTVQCTIIEKIGQAFFSGSMSLWDEEHDNYITTKYETHSFVCLCVIFGIYSE